MIAFLSLLYGVYMLTFVVDGLGLRIGLFEGDAPFALTVIPAIFGACLIAVFLAMLELVKQGTLHVTQEETFADIQMETKEVAVPKY